MSTINHVEAVEEWKAAELQTQQERIEQLGRGFAHLHLLRQERQNSSCPEITISDIALAANIAYGPNISSTAILDFANQAYFADFLHKTDILGTPEFRTKVFAGIINLEEIGLIQSTNGFAEYTHIDYQPTTE